MPDPEDRHRRRPLWFTRARKDRAARADAARDAMRRAVDMTDAARAESDHTLGMTVLRLREAARRNCEVCSHQVEVGGTCSCSVRCTDRACRRDPELAEGDVSIP